MANDISGTVAALVIANYCSARKTRWIGVGMFIVVIATIIPASTTLFAEVSQLIPMYIATLYFIINCSSLELKWFY